MDTQELITETKARFNHNSAKIYLKNKYQSKLIVAEQGGLWKATPEIIGFLSTITTTHCVILDTYENPITVDATKLQIKLIETYRIVMDQWYTEYSSLEKK
jgi:hypothetical protein